MPKTKTSRRRRGWHVFTGYTCDYYRPEPAFRKVDDLTAGARPPWEELDIGTVLPTMEDYIKAHRHGDACGDALKVRIEIRISYLRWTPEESDEFGEKLTRSWRQRRGKTEESG